MYLFQDYVIIFGHIFLSHCICNNVFGHEHVRVHAHTHIHTHTYTHTQRLMGSYNRQYNLIQLNPGLLLI